MKDEPWTYGRCDGCDYNEAVTVGDMWAHIDNPGRFCWRALEDAALRVMKAHRGSRTSAHFAAHLIMNMVRLGVEEGKKIARLEDRDA